MSLVSMRLTVIPALERVYQGITQMVGNELLHSESIPRKVYEACDAGHAEMGTLERSTKTQM